MRWLLLAALPAVVLGQCFSEQDQIPTNDSSARTALYKGQQRFSIDMLKIMNEYKNGQNIFFSPHSIYQSLLLAYFSAANETEKMIQKALYLPETQTKIETLHSFGMEKYFQNMRQASASDYEYQIANKMFIAKDIPTKQCIETLLAEELEKIDFQSDPTGALEQINSWVANITKDHITDLVPADAIGPDTSLVLANAAYFKGFWKSKFLKESTKQNDLFYSSTSVIRVVDMMRQKGTFNHMVSEKLKAHVLEMPYKGGDVSMIVILPRAENNAIDKVIKQLSDEALTDILEYDSFYMKPIEVEIPKFTVEETIDLSMPFKRMGLTDLFKNTTDFSALTGNDEAIHFSDAIHKAKVEVDEEGTVAAAATAIFSFRSSRPLDPTIFKANHPFIYMVYDKVSQNILFLGAYRLPAKKAFSKKQRQIL